jgi:uncharacterized membrane protein
MKQSFSRILLALFFIAAGVLHFIFPQQYASVVPAWLPWHSGLVAISGLCEIAGGIGVLPSQTRKAAGIGLILLSLAVLPANVQMLLDAQADGKASWIIALLWLRLPLQLLLIAWIWQATRLRRTARF